MWSKNPMPVLIGWADLDTSRHSTLLVVKAAMMYDVVLWLRFRWRMELMEQASEIIELPLMIV